MATTISNQKAEYLQYIGSKAWIKKSREFRKKVGACEICGSREFLQSHHMTYENLGKETFNDLACLCGAHHEQYHSIVPSYAMPSVIGLSRELRIDLIRRTLESGQPVKRRKKKKNKNRKESPKVQRNPYRAPILIPSGEKIELTFDLLWAATQGSTQQIGKRQAACLGIEGLYPDASNGWMLRVIGTKVSRESYEAYANFHSASACLARSKEKKSKRAQRLARKLEKRRMVHEAQAINRAARVESASANALDAAKVVVLTKDLINAGRTPAGGFNHAQLRYLGVDGTKTKWISNLVGQRVLLSDYNQFLFYGTQAGIEETRASRRASKRKS